ncbi:hypothetical protein L7F22_065092 [Adiantum nelumboides]|nr:hypothetical protein [Adiantum nelumboides]
MVEHRRGGGLIKPIDKARICSGQVILDLSMAVKELVENSLDAGATSIEIKVKDYGADSLEVADNGCGVSPDNYQALMLKYHTSKISDFADLQSLSSFGFRGEALSSLCALGDLSIVTRTKNEPVATHLLFDHSGSIISQKSEARPVGTTVIVSGLFKSLPVRHKEFTKNIRREYSRLLTVLHGYALIAKNVRLVCSHLAGKTRTMILKTQGTSSIKDNIITIFGTKMAACLEPVDLVVGSDCRIEGFVSKPGSGSGRPSGDRQFLYINSRPVEIPKVSKMLNELYRSFNYQQFPMAVLNFFLPAATYDVNVTPDKRKVFLHAESELVQAFRLSLENVYAPERYTFTVQKLENTNLGKESPMLMELLEFETQKCNLEELSQRTVSTQVEMSEDEDKDPVFMKEVAVKENMDDFSKKKFITCSEGRVELDSFQCGVSIVSTNLNGGSISTEKDAKTDCRLSEKRQAATLQQKVVQSKLSGFVLPVKRAVDDAPLSSEEPLLKKWLLSRHSSSENMGLPCHRRDNLHTENRESDVANEKCSLLTLRHEQSGSHISVQEMEDTEILEENSCSIDSPDYASVPEDSCNLARYDKGFVRCNNYFNKDRLSEKKRRPFLAASMGFDHVANGDSGKEGKEEALAAATRELERTFNKADFKKMKVLGQFNLGFILAKLNGDLFIIDQHASDEKHNFERLSKTTVLNRQPLLRPLPLDFSAAEEVIVMTHVETFRCAGVGLFTSR